MDKLQILISGTVQSSRKEFDKFLDQD